MREKLLKVFDCCMLIVVTINERVVNWGVVGEKFCQRVLKTTDYYVDVSADLFEVTTGYLGQGRSAFERPKMSVGAI